MSQVNYDNLLQVVPPHYALGCKLCGNTLVGWQDLLKETQGFSMEQQGWFLEDLALKHLQTCNQVDGEDTVEVF